MPDTDPDQPTNYTTEEPTGELQDSALADAETADEGDES